MGVNAEVSLESLIARYGIEPTPQLPFLTASFSSPAGGNPTGAMVEAAYRNHSIPARYVNMDIAPSGLEAAFRGAQAMRLIGFNCSLPHKRAIIPFVDELAPSAQLIGAVNCVTRDRDTYIGHNTDGQGFLAALKSVASPVGANIVILGAGGAARAIAIELALAGAERITLVARRAEVADAIAARINEERAAVAVAQRWAGDYAVAESTSILVNATSVGLAPHLDARLDLNTTTIHPDMTVCDVIPNPPKTNLLRDAIDRGATVIDGRGMLIEQAALNVRLWTGVNPDTNVMRAALDQAIGDWRHPTGQ